MAVDGKIPALALVVTVEQAFIHCGKCMIRSRLWEKESWPDVKLLPSQAQCLVDHGNLRESVEEVQASIEERRRTALY
jgi:predicted pyridoxine 5'-phosphate oxidase superfamily flavin-nucleotide-binding protein